MIKVALETIDPKLIRSQQAGDWDYTDNLILAYVAKDRYPQESELAIAIHELIEAYLCRRDGIRDYDVVKFDDQYEKERADGKHPDNTEPGDAEDSPYRLQHQAATHVERAVIAALGISWEAHEQAVQHSADAPRNSGQPSYLPQPV